MFRLLSPSLRSQIVKISRHLFNLCVVMVLDLLDEARVLRQHKVDRCTFTAESTGSTNSMDVVFLLDGQLVVDDKANLLDIDTTGKEISSNEDAYGALTELLHDDVTFDLVHFSVHNRDSEFVLCHGLLELLDALLGVAVDEGLVDVEVGVEVKEDVHLPLVLFDGDIVLADTFESELLGLDQNLRWFAHEVLGELQNIRRERS